MICLIVTVSFVTFAVDQTKNASLNQQELIRRESATASLSVPVSAGTPATHETSLHKTIDEASEELTSPFTGIVSGSSGEWANRSLDLALALIVYGFGLAYLARVLRVGT